MVEQPIESSAAQPASYPEVPPPEKKSRTGLIIGIAVGVFLLLCCCCLIILLVLLGPQIQDALEEFIRSFGVVIPPVLIG